MSKEPVDFEEVYRRFLGDVYRFCLSMTQDAQTAEELTQETFFKALNHFHQFKGDCKVSVWLCQIAKNTYFSQKKHQKRILFTDSFPENPRGVPQMEDEYILKETAFSIHQALHLLSEPYKEVFYLRTFGELSYEQIGQIFQKSDTWARVTYYRAKQKILQLLKDGDDL